jgi:hypothetical protein
MNMPDKELTCRIYDLNIKKAVYEGIIVKSLIVDLGISENDYLALITH